MDIVTAAPEGLSAGARGTHPELSGLLSRISAYDAKADPALIEDAYSLAAQAHAAQKRDNGEPYITHPLAVATILGDLCAEFGVSRSTVDA